MKAEDIELAWDAAIKSVENYPYGNNIWELKLPIQREALKAFARACEQHVIERAKAGAEGRIVRSAHGHSGPGVELDWSALDAEIAKENEGEG